MCPLSMGLKCSGYCLSHWWANPENSDMYPCCNATCSINRAGLNRVACAKATSSTGDAMAMAAWAVWPMVRVQMSSFYNLVVSVHVPDKMTTLLWLMVVVDAVKATLQLAPHN